MKTFFYTLFLLLLGIGIGFYFGVNKGAPTKKEPAKVVEEKKEVKDDVKEEKKSEIEGDVLDCGGDEDCLENSLDNCTPAHFEGEGPLDSLVTIKMTEDRKNCLLNFNLGDEELNCEIPLSHVSQANDALDSGDADFLNEYCGGSLLSELTGESTAYSPAIGGAQTRARDTAMIADLNNISQALEVYYSDYGQYPDADEGNCLDSEAESGNESAKALAMYMKGNKLPKSIGADLNSISCIGSFYYQPLSRGEADNNSYVLAADVVNWQMANYQLTAVDDDSVFSGTSEEVTEGIGKLETETEDSMMSIYVVIP